MPPLLPDGDARGLSSWISERRRPPTQPGKRGAMIVAEKVPQLDELSLTIILSLEMQCSVALIFVHADFYRNC